jgi:hypothetical protein
MYVQSVLLQIEDRFSRDGKPMSPKGKEAFYRTLKPYEAGSLRPKTEFLAQLVGLDKGFSDAYSLWQFEWAKRVLPRRIEAHLEAAGFAALEAARQDFALKIGYWTRQIEGDAVQSARQLREVADTIRARKPQAVATLEKLLAAMQPNMLFSEVLEQAHRENISLTVDAEGRIEAALAARQQALIRPVEEKIGAWKALDPSLRAALAKAEAGEKRQLKLARLEQEKELRERKRQEAAARALEEREKLEQERLQAEARAREERERQEQARMEALIAEQRRAEEAQREQFRSTLNSWKNLQLPGNGLMAMDSATRSALDTRAEKLKTSEMGSGRKQLKVESSKFSDTLAFVEKFSVAETRIDLSKMSLEEKASQSAYVFASPSGRTSPKDLDHFVQNVALGSFETYYRFLSYLAPQRWRPGGSLAEALKERKIVTGTIQERLRELALDGEQARQRRG